MSSFIDGETEGRIRRGLGICEVVRANGIARRPQTSLHVRNTSEASKNIHAYLDGTPKSIYYESLEKVCGREPHVQREEK